MKILITQETDWLKRNPHQQHHLAEMMVLRGHEVRVIDYEILWKTQGRKELYSKREVFSNVSKIHDEASVTVIRPGIIKILGLDYLSLLYNHRKEIKRQFNEFKPDVVICFGILNSYLVSRMNKVPFIYYWIDVLHELIPFSPLRFIGKYLERQTLEKASRVLVINEKLREYVLEMGACPRNTAVLGAGIDLKRYNLKVDGSKVREQYGIREEDIVLFFMGWLYKFSGLWEVARAMYRDKRFKLLIVGDGDAYEELQSLRRKYNLQDQIILAGRKPYDEMPAHIAASDICLLPANPQEKVMQNIVPIKLYEYMAMGKPVVTTNLPAIIKEFGASNGIIYAYRSDLVFSRCEDIVSDKSIKEKGLRSRRFVENRSWRKITDAFETVIENTIKENNRERLFGEL
ncbi:hypothetical protein LCGC14_0913230 [marine sediment metagenome]|uniref:Glycosyltransferase subfamily 4-like N-terminal domain-containing protein n=1 Tax=marine sediment metagenome TaxID=412755 RepID=A0A0F9NXK9_9ZZZZ